MNKVEKELRLSMQKELKENILSFWMENAVDEEKGGFIGKIAHDGTLVPDANKGGILNARILWTFSAAYRLYGKGAYLEMANRAYRYIVSNFVDAEYGGTYWELDSYGKPVNTRKQVYALAFTIYGLVEYFRAYCLKDALDTAVSLFLDIEKYSFDTKKGGYFEAYTREWEVIDDLRLSEKDHNESKTMNTHLHILEAYTNLYRVWKGDVLKAQLKNLVELFLDKFVNEDYNLNLFFDDNWNKKSDFISFGHDIEASWLIVEAAEVLGNGKLIERSKETAIKMAEKNMAGLDKDGGLYYEYFPSEDKWDTDKHWWSQAEAVVAYYNAWKISGKKEFLDIATKSWGFIQEYLVDKKNGEWYWSVNKEGKPSKGEKAGFWKCPYHNGRACMEIIERTEPQD